MGWAMRDGRWGMGDEAWVMCDGPAGQPLLCGAGEHHGGTEGGHEDWNVSRAMVDQEDAQHHLSRCWMKRSADICPVPYWDQACEWV